MNEEALRFVKINVQANETEIGICDNTHDRSQGCIYETQTPEQIAALIKKAQEIVIGLLRQVNSQPSSLVNKLALECTLYEKAYDAFRYYVDASDIELKEANITREKALENAREAEQVLVQYVNKPTYYVTLALEDLFKKLTLAFPFENKGRHYLLFNPMLGKLELGLHLREGTRGFVIDDEPLDDSLIDAINHLLEQEKNQHAS